MLSLSGLGLLFVSLWFCSEAQGRPHGEDSHCSNQNSGVPQLAQTWPGSSSLCQCLMPFLCVLGCCADEAGWCLALPLQRTLALFWCPCCVFWGTQHDYTRQLTMTGTWLQGHSPACPPQAWDIGMAKQSGCPHTSPS